MTDACILTKRIRRSFRIGSCIAAAFISVAVFCCLHNREANRSVFTPDAVFLTPWASIGGCGAGGSGGAGGGNIKWIGRGVTGGLLDIQVLSNIEVSQTRRNVAFTPRFSCKPSYTTQLALTVPVLSKIGQFQPQAQLDPATMVAGGIGDLMFDFSKNLGMSGQYSLMATLTVPTGQWDISRGSEKSPQVLSNMLQLGTGIYSGSLGLSYSRDFDKSMLIIDFLGTYPFALNLEGANAHNDKTSGGWGYDIDLMNDEQKRRFEYFFKPYGENDLGGYTPPSLFLAAYYGDKRFAGYVYSYGMTFSVPLGITWIPSYLANTYDPIPDPDFQTWSGTLQYGIEFSHEKHPVYIVVSKLIHDKASVPNQIYRYDPEYVNKWNGPDWRDFASTWSITIGIKATAF